MKRLLLILALAMVPTAGTAAEVIQLADNGGAPKRFMTLDGVRRDNGVAVKVSAKTNANGVRVLKSKKLRSDADQMSKGFMRIDRARSTPTGASGVSQPIADASPAGPLVVNVAEELKLIDDEEVDGNTDMVDPVLALFDASDESSPLSFRDALTGRSAAGVDGVARHLVWPVPLNVAQKFTSGYGVRNDPFHGRKTFHGGIDIAAPVGTPVLATADGDVMQVTSDSRYGKYIGIQHADGTISRYGHLSAQNVREGDRVRAGQTIGAVGSTGRSTGAHLDYRISKGGVKFDPLAVLSMPSAVTMASGSGDAPLVKVTAAERPTRIMQEAKRSPLVIKVR